jgi:hypothetical protein
MRRTCSYQRRAPEGGVLFKVLQQHLDTFLLEANAADCGAAGVPVFVEKCMRRAPFQRNDKTSARGSRSCFATALDRRSLTSVCV